jgi:hypothetical protein
MSEDKQRDERTWKWASELYQRAMDLRSKDREFHGLDREFLYQQRGMLSAYNKSKDVKHPRDVGDAREEILRKFLTTSGYLPKRYGVSHNSARVASTTGHISKEIDILLFDPLDSVCLMNRESVYEVFPVESVYGVVQVKSRLNKREITEGLENLASFKVLDRQPDTQTGFKLRDGRLSERGFGILFAFDSDLEWLDIIHHVESFANQHPNRLWCNAVFILSKGFFFHGEGNRGVFTNPYIEKIQKLRMFGIPDRENQCLYQFYSTLLALLRDTAVQPAPANSYFRLPLIADEYSYEFCRGPFAELSSCDRHGDFQRKIAADQLVKLVDWCRTTEPINWIKAIDIAYGRPGDNAEAYARQPGDVRIYNPENLPLSDILVMDSSLEGKAVKSLAFDDIRCAGMIIFIPYYYSAKEQIISGCSKCEN